MTSSSLDDVESPNPSTSQFVPPLISQYSTIPDTHLLEELLVKIQYFNKRASSYYILTDLFNTDSCSIESEINKTPEILYENYDDSGLNFSFMST